MLIMLMVIMQTDSGVVQRKNEKRRPDSRRSDRGAFTGASPAGRMGVAPHQLGKSVVEPVRIVTPLTPELLQHPQLRPLLGKTVEIIVREEPEPSQPVPSRWQALQE